MEETNAKTLEILERERERESCNIEDMALNSCLGKNTSLPTCKLYIIYKRIQINMLRKHR